VAIQIQPSSAVFDFVHSGDPCAKLDDKTRKHYGITKDAHALVLREHCKSAEGATVFSLRPLSAGQVIEIERLNNESNTAAALQKCVSAGLAQIDGGPPPDTLVFYVETAINAAVLALSLGQITGN
jgi:hypothetical protein